MTKGRDVCGPPENGFFWLDARAALGFVELHAGGLPLLAVVVDDGDRVAGAMVVHHVRQVLHVS